MHRQSTVCLSVKHEPCAQDVPANVATVVCCSCTLMTMCVSTSKLAIADPVALMCLQVHFRSDKIHMRPEEIAAKQQKAAELQDELKQQIQAKQRAKVRPRKFATPNLPLANLTGAGLAVVSQVDLMPRNRPAVTISNWYACKAGLRLC